MAYRMVYLRIRSDGYHFGWTSDTEQAAFKDESRRIFQELGWTLTPGSSGVCDTVAKGHQDGRHFLSKQGIAEIKSMLAKEIFQQDLISIYQRQTQRRDELTGNAEELMRQLVSEMQSGTLNSQRIGQLMAELAQRLHGHSGKNSTGICLRR